MTHVNLRTTVAARQILDAVKVADEDTLRGFVAHQLAGTLRRIPGGWHIEIAGTGFPGFGTLRRALATWARFVLAPHTSGALATMLALLDGHDAMARARMIDAAVIATGGTWVRPAQREGEWHPSAHYEISLFNILGRGSDEIDATRDWAAAAARVLREAA